MQRDPQPYDGPLRDINGKRPYNMYLWWTESWWAGHPGPDCLHPHIGGEWRFGIVALDDGRFCVDGQVWMIEQNDCRYSWTRKDDHKPLPNNFNTRLGAIRASAARMIRAVRRHDRRHRQPYERLNKFGPVTADELIEWARDIVAYEEWRELHPLEESEE